MSTETKFRHGPWNAHGNAIYGPDRWSVALVTIHKPDLSEGSEAAANARLIAAAPDMYELLRKILNANPEASVVIENAQSEIDQLLNRINQ